MSVLLALSSLLTLAPKAFLALPDQPAEYVISKYDHLTLNLKDEQNE